MDIRDFVNFDPDEALELIVDIPEQLLDYRQERDNAENQLRGMKNKLDRQEALVRKDLRENPESFGFLKTKKPTIQDANDVVTLTPKIITLRDSVAKLEFELDSAVTNQSVVYRGASSIDRVLANQGKDMNVGAKYKGSMEERKANR